MPHNMKIALLHDHLNQIGGAERVVRTMHAMWPDAPLFTLVHDKKKIKGFFGDLVIKTSFIQKLPLSLSKLRWYLFLMPKAMESLDLTGYDVMVSSASAFGKGAIPPKGTVHICYCHTPTRYLWSDAESYLSELRVNPITKHFLAKMLEDLRVWDKKASTRVHHFIANSKFIQERIKKYYDRESTVIYPPVDTKGYPLVDNKKPYFIILGRLRPYKRMDLAIRAFNRLGMQLIVAGDGEERAHLEKIAGDTIRFVGDVSDEEKKSLLAHASGFIHPQEEDFGIALVEAMAAGTPVIAYDAGGARETVIEGKTGLFFEEQTWQSLADAVIRARHTTFDYQAIRDHAELFSEERFKKELSEFVMEHAPQH